MLGFSTLGAMSSVIVHTAVQQASCRLSRK